MARRKKSSKKSKTSSRRRRIGATALNVNNPLVKILPVAVGYFMGNQVNTLLDKVIPATLDQKLVGVGQSAVGALIAYRGKKTMLNTVAGGVLLGSGVKRAMGAFGIGGFQSVPVINGYDKVPVIGAPGVSRVGGYTTAPVALNGYYGARVPINGMDSTLMDR